MHLIDFTDIEKMVYDHSYDLAAVTLVWEVMKTVERSALSPIPAAQRLSYDFLRGELFLFITFGNIFVAVHKFQHRVALPVINAITRRDTFPFRN